MKELVSGTISEILNSEILNSEILNSEMGRVAGIVIGLLLGAFIAYEVLKKIKAEKNKSQEAKYDMAEDFLKNKFGDIVYANTLTVGDVNKWIRAQNLFGQGYKVFISKADGEHTKIFWRELKLDLGEIDFDKRGKFLIIIIAKEEEFKKVNDIKKQPSVLIKYDQLNPELESCLDSNGKRTINI